MINAVREPDGTLVSHSTPHGQSDIGSGSVIADRTMALCTPQSRVAAINYHSVQ